MADFKKALAFMPSNEGTAKQGRKSKENGKFILCARCLTDEGLRLDASHNGILNDKKCANCGSVGGHKLTKEHVEELCHRFFVRGTIHRTKYGGAPVIQFNNHHYNKSTFKCAQPLARDVRLIEQAIKVGLFHYGPNLWMVGHIEPLKDLQNSNKRDKVIDRIVKTYPGMALSKKHQFYRVRVNPSNPDNPSEYDSTPLQFLGRNRLDSYAFPVLYTSPDLQLCIHECRTTAEDNIYVAKMVPTRRLKLLDLTAIIENNAPDSDSLDLAVHFLFLAGKHSYKICRAIAIKAKDQGFDGLIYPSYFSSLRTGGVPFESVSGISYRRIPQFKRYAQSQIAANVAFFGWPIKEKKIAVSCINKVIINQVGYDLSFGPPTV